MNHIDILKEIYTTKYMIKYRNMNDINKKEDTPRISHPMNKVSKFPERTTILNPRKKNSMVLKNRLYPSSRCK